MELHIHLHHHYDDKMFTEIKSINTNIKNMANELDSLIEEVRESKTLQQSAITLITGLKTKLDEAIANNDMSRVVALRDELDSSNTEFAAAITANTPAENGGTGNNGGTTDPGTTPGTDPNANL